MPRRCTFTTIAFDPENPANRSTEIFEAPTHQEAAMCAANSRHSHAERSVVFVQERGHAYSGVYRIHPAQDATVSPMGPHL